MKNKVTDTLYFGSDLGGSSQSNARLEQGFIEDVKSRYPDARLDNAYEKTMGYSQHIEIEDVDPQDYYAWVVARGWKKVSLGMAATASVKPRFLTQVTKRAKQQYPNLFEE